MTDLQSIKQQLAQEGRFCPKPHFWDKLWHLLPSLRRKGAKHESLDPLILAAWHHSSDGENCERFLTNLRWEHDHGVLKAILVFLDTLRPDDWHVSEKDH